MNRLIQLYEELEKHRNRIGSSVFSSSQASYPNTPTQKKPKFGSSVRSKIKLQNIINPVLVQWIQNSLNMILGSNLATDGVKGNLTKTALQDFQMKVGISSHGDVNVHTISEIEKYLANLPVRADTDNLNFKKWVQMALNLIYFRAPSGDCGLYQTGGLAVDGEFGDQTKAAILDFQKRYSADLAATGTLDQDTILKLTQLAAALPTKIDGSSLDLQVPTYEGVNWVDHHYQGNDIPVAFLKAWILKEAGGKMTSWTRQLDERGYMQLHPEESWDLCIDHLRLSWDWNYSFMQGLRYIRNYMKLVDNLGFSKATDLYWRLVKLCHWTSPGVKSVVKYMESNGFRPQNHSWDDFKSFINSNYQGVKNVARIDPGLGTNNVDDTFKAAKQYGYNL